MVTDIGNITKSDGTVLLKMWEVSVPEGKRTLQNHSHIRFEITTINAGSGIYTVGKHTYPMLPGDVFIFSSNEQHCITSIGKDGLKITNLHFEPQYLWGNSADSLSDENSNFCFFHNEAFQNRIEAKKAAPLYALFMGIKEELLQCHTEYALSVKSILNMLLIKMIREYHYAGERADLTRNIRRVLEYIDSHLTEELSLKSLAEIAGVSPNYFSTQFHNASGITLWDYINSKRIDKAVHLIMEEEPKTMLEIALQCGFNNTTNFNKIFKKITGMTPTEYRKAEYFY